jgi:Ca-activated chloride channel family protein
VTFTSPGRLWLLVAVAALGLAHVLLQHRRSRSAVHLPGLALLASVAPRLGWRRHVAATALLLSMVGATAAFAEPRAEVAVPRERATLVVALDVSLSMAATDVEPDRLTAAKAAAVEFVEGLPATFDVGLVAFSGTAAIAVTPTQDHTAVTAAIDDLALGDGTAIGEAVASSLTAVAGARTGVEEVPAHVVLLSDGASTVGRPVSAAVQDAVAAGVPVSTIAYGTQDGEVRIERQRIRVPVDAPALAALAADTGGTAYEAASGDELQDVYDDVATTVGSTTESREVSSGVAGLALLSAVGAGAAALAWSPRSL